MTKRWLATAGALALAGCITRGTGQDAPPVTKYFLLGQSGEADNAPSANGNGRMILGEPGRSLKDTLTCYARRYYGRDQTAQIVRG